MIRLNIYPLTVALCGLITEFGGAQAPQTEGVAPRHKVDLGAEFQQLGLTPLQQGDRGDCSLFAVTALVEFELARNSQMPPARLSEEYLIWAAHAGTRAPGDQAMFYEAVHGLNTLGICTDALMRYQQKDDPARKPSPKARADAKARGERWQAHWIKRWDRHAGSRNSRTSADQG